MTSLPLHPLLVHIPVVLVPLVLLMALPSLLSRRWFQWTAPITLALSSVAAVGGVLATWSGEDLEHTLGEESALLERHAQLGELTRTLAVLLFLVLLVQVALFWHRSPAATRRYGERWPALFLVLGLAVAGLGIADTVAAVQAGHAGAQLVWQDAAGGSDAPASDPAAPPAGDGDGDAD